MGTTQTAPQSFYRPKYQPEQHAKDDCAAFRRNILRHCFNHEDELQAIALRQYESGGITLMDYTVEIAYSNARKGKYREMIEQHLKPEDRLELANELRPACPLHPKDKVR